MGYKSRGNYKPGLCMKFDCKNRDKKCKECMGSARPSHYIKGGNDYSNRGKTRSTNK